MLTVAAPVPCKLIQFLQSDLTYISLLTYSTTNRYGGLQFSATYTNLLFRHQSLGQLPPGPWSSMCEHLLEFIRPMWPKYDRHLALRISTIICLSDSSFKYIHIWCLDHSVGLRHLTHGWEAIDLIPEQLATK